MNAHVVLASRGTVPVPLARLSASAQVARLDEGDLLFDDRELLEFAATHAVAPALLASSGGWPALAELTASTGADLVLDYLWEEVLTALGPSRAGLLARFATVGGGDDQVAAAIADAPIGVDDIVASVPLVERSRDGWAAPHPLWEPALRSLLTEDEAAAARRRAADVHRERGRFGLAVDLLVEAEAWDGVLAVVREAERRGAAARAAPSGGSAARVLPGDFGRWYRILPPDWRREPEALMAAALELQARGPADAIALFDAAAEGFRAKADVDGELAVISHAGLVRWWLNDAAGLMVLFGRVSELAAAGSEQARVLEAIALGGLAHLQGDSAGVLSALAGVEERADRGWLGMIHWLRSVAHRRSGDLERALDELDRVVDPDTLGDPQVELARLRCQWLAGGVDEVIERLPAIDRAYVQSGDRFLARETGLELAAKAAVLGDLETSGTVLPAALAALPDFPNALADVLSTIARAATAVAEGDEETAAALVRAQATSGPAALGTAGSWYWRDRAAIALVHVLVPESREAWAAEALGPAHRPGLLLAEAIEAVRSGDLGPLRGLVWPTAGEMRAHLPVRWAVELAAAGVAATNPPPDALLLAIGGAAGPVLRELAASHPVRPVAAAAKRLAAELPVTPVDRLRIGVLGPLQLWRGGEAYDHPELRRLRVRELLCYLVAVRRVRREAVGEELWPEVADPAHNLRVTLSYLQRVLQPDRSQGERPYFLRASGDWLELAGGEWLEVDAWELEAHLDAADAAARTGAVATALASYAVALALWRGEPYVDHPYVLWAEPERARLRARFTAAALRAGELWLAAGAVQEARRAADQALRADAASEAAYRLLARTHLAEDDPAAARAALERCRAALMDLAVEPDATTADLMARVLSGAVGRGAERPNGKGEALAGRMRPEPQPNGTEAFGSGRGIRDEQRTPRSCSAHVAQQRPGQVHAGEAGTAELLGVRDLLRHRVSG